MFMQCILELGRNGYPGQKGQRGDHGLPGPNVIDLTSHLRSLSLYVLNLFCRHMVVDVLDHFLAHQAIPYVSAIEMSGHRFRYPMLSGHVR